MKFKMAWPLIPILVPCSIAWGDTIHVPMDYPDIQQAIDAAVDGDEIVVAPGTYHEAINFIGKAVHLRSSGGREVTTIDATGLDASVVTCTSDEGPETAIRGFTITGGRGTLREDGFRYGGGVYNLAAAPMVVDCALAGNSATFGGGSFDEEGRLTVTGTVFRCNTASQGAGMHNHASILTAVTNCTFVRNSAELDGGGMYNWSGTTTVIGSVFQGNAAGLGGGIYNWSGRVTVIGCAFVGNTSDFGGGMYNQLTNAAVVNSNFIDNSSNQGGAMFNNLLSMPRVVNGILRGNVPDEITDGLYSEALVLYSSVEGGHEGEGNIDEDPLWVRVPDPGPDGEWGTEDDDYGDLRLQAGSPSIDSGLNGPVASVAVDSSGRPRFMDDPASADAGPWWPPVDMGAHEFQAATGCGNSVCESEETCETCPYDCGDCDGILLVPGELPTIQSAIITAANEDEIVVEAGTYREAISFLGKAVVLRSSAGPEATIIDATGLYASVVTCSGGEGAESVLEGFTITGGTGTPDGSLDDGGGMYNSHSSPTVTRCWFINNSTGLGGGMYNDESDPALIDCRFSGNGATWNGGGMYNTGSTPVIVRCTFDGNTAERGGGGVKNVLSSPSVTECSFTANTGSGMANDRSSPSVTACTFSANTTTGPGGGMHNNISSPTVTNCTFRENTARHGGGMENGAGSPTIINSTFIQNTAQRFGGGMYNAYDSGASVIDCAFDENTASQGGGMHNDRSSSVVVTNCTFNRNVAVTGGGMRNWRSDPLVMGCSFSRNSRAGMVNEESGPTVTNCTFTGNASGAMSNENESYTIVTNCIFSGNIGRLGGAMTNSTGSNTTVVNCTFGGNAADSGGGGIYNRGPETILSLINSILWGNIPAQIHNDDDATSDVHYCDIEDGYEGVGNIEADPLFMRAPDPGPDGEWGTEDDDYGDLHLRADSPCIDAGDSAAVPVDVTTDFDGHTRLVDDPQVEDTGEGGCPIVDMGAYEMQAEGGCCLRAPRWQCDGDVDGDGQVNPVDLGLVQAAFGSIDEQDVCNFDMDCDGQINPADAGIVQSLFGTCEVPRAVCP